MKSGRNGYVLPDANNAVDTTHEHRRRLMIVYYLQAHGPHDIDRALPLIAAIGDDPVVVSNLARPLHAHALPCDWIQIPNGLDPSRLDQILGTRTDESTVVLDGPAADLTHVLSGRGRPAKVAVVARPGGGNDGELGAVYSQADLLVAPWPAHATRGWPAAWAARTVHVGLQGQVAARERLPRTSPPAESRRCVVITGQGAGPQPRERQQIIQATSGWMWSFATEHALDESGPVWDQLHKAAVLVCPPDEQPLTAAAHLLLPTVVVVPPRPTCGQRDLAQMVDVTGAALVLDGWPLPETWGEVLGRARLLDASGWRGWAPLDAPTQLAAVLNAEAPTEATAPIDPTSQIVGT